MTTEQIIKELLAAYKYEKHLSLENEINFNRIEELKQLLKNIYQ